MKELIMNQIGNTNFSEGAHGLLSGLWEGVGVFFRDEEGVGTIEIVLILVVLIALIFIFRNRLTALIKKVFDAMDESAAELYETKN